MNPAAPPTPRNQDKFRPYLGALLGLTTFLGIMYLLWPLASSSIAYSEFKTLLASGKVSNVEIEETRLYGLLDLRGVEGILSEDELKTLRRGRGGDTGVPFNTNRAPDPDLAHDLQRANVRYSQRGSAGWLSGVISWVIPIALVILMTNLWSKRLGGAGDLIGVGKSNARVFVQRSLNVKFEDVEGIDDAKAELIEVVDFLKNPQRYRALGGRIPKGVLIVGAPGTGKTLLAKAVAGEANVPFLSMSGSEFVEMFVGVGAARVRDLFAQAEQLAPCIIFIDELDALGKARSASGWSGHEEREQTLNQLLVEMDGFNTNKGVIIMAATNRAEILDPALLRPGRFDRHIAIDRPDVRGREKILRLHAKHLKLGGDVQMDVLAAETPGCAGADLANIVNEAALHAAREGKSAVSMPDFEYAVERMLTGLERRSRIMNPRERETVAFHEAGHAIVAETRAGADHVAKISIIPRGFGALGFTQQLPTEERYLLKRSELLDRLDVLLAGRIAEVLRFREPSTGAQDDLQRATDLARHMVAQYGMSDALGALVVELRAPPVYIPAKSPPMECSAATSDRIDTEVSRILQAAEERVRRTLTERYSQLEALAAHLLKVETIQRGDFLKVLAEHGSAGLQAVV